jgi:hypothetical protein
MLLGRCGAVNFVPVVKGEGGFASYCTSNSWVAEGGSNLLWLPPAYRASCSAVWNEAIVLGHSSGRISILRFKEGLRIICE